MFKKIKWYSLAVVITSAFLMYGFTLYPDSEMVADNEVNPDNTVFTIESVTKGDYGTAPDFTWMQNGKEVKFSKFVKGKYVFVNFFGTWCPPCRKELPDIIEISKEMNGKGLVVIGIALERNPSTAVKAVKLFAKQKNIPYMIFVDTKQQLAAAYGGINAVPTSFFVDLDNKIAQAKTGAASKDAFMKIIKSIMK